MGSSSDSFDMQQKKSHDEVVKWNEYEALRDHLKKQIDQSDEEWRAELQRVDLKLDATATQESVTNMEESITALTRQIADLATFVQRRDPQENDNASVHGGNPHGNKELILMVAEVREAMLLLMAVGFMPSHGECQCPKIIEWKMVWVNQNSQFLLSP